MINALLFQNMIAKLFNLYIKLISTIVTVTFFVSSVIAQEPLYDSYLEAFYENPSGTYIMYKQDKKGIFGNPHVMVNNVLIRAKNFANKNSKTIVEIDRNFHPMGILGDWASFTYTFQLINDNQTSSLELSNEHNILKLAGEENIIFNSFDRVSGIDRIFVLPISGNDCNGNKNIGQEIASLAEAMLLGKYDILERHYFEKTLYEKIHLDSVLIFQEIALEIASESGAQGILFTETGCLEQQNTISLKLVSCQSSEIYWNCLGINSSGIATINRAIKKLP